jgi:hypothetical protein
MQTGSHQYSSAQACMICTQLVAARLVRYFCSNVCLVCSVLLEH